MGRGMGVEKTRAGLFVCASCAAVVKFGKCTGSSGPDAIATSRSVPEGPPLKRECVQKLIAFLRFVRVLPTVHVHLFFVVGLSLSLELPSLTRSLAHSLTRSPLPPFCVACWTAAWLSLRALFSCSLRSLQSFTCLVLRKPCLHAHYVGLCVRHRRNQ